MHTVVVQVQQKSQKVWRGRGEESLSAKGGGTGWMNLVKELDQLDKEDEEDMVWIELK